MTHFDALLLGLIQGITEFLPVSSTGHLIIARALLGIETELELSVDALFHFATAFAVLLYFRKDLISLAKSFWDRLHGIPFENGNRVLFLALLFGTIPAVVAGLLLEDTMDTLFRDPHLVAWVLIAGSLLFVVAEYVTKHTSHHTELTVRKGVYVGFFQALALLPGMSRSGATISGGMLLGLSRERAARFAFLLSFPIIIGAGSKKLLELSSAGVGQGEWLTIGVGVFAAFASGIACIHFLMRFLKNHTLYVFVVYRILLAFTVFALI